MGFGGAYGAHVPRQSHSPAAYFSAMLGPSVAGMFSLINSLMGIRGFQNTWLQAHSLQR